MKIGVLSDSHQNIENLKKAIEYLVEKEKVEVVVHLGDDYDDLRGIENRTIKIIQVPGVFSHWYQDKSIPNRMIIELSNWRVLISHTEKSHSNDLPDDLRPEEARARGEVDLILYGHSHIPGVKREGKVTLINPGHLKKVDKKGHPPSFALLVFTPQKLKSQIIELESSKVINEVTLTK